MSRALRIEFENACYHVMARGNQRRDIVFDDDDRQLFVDTLGEACERAGWRVYAWVLMSNHYHLVMRTPEANLVSGMTWFQNAFTRRMNAKNGLWGRLFGDRYKSVLVEADPSAGPAGSTAERLTRPRSRVREADYLPVLIDYVHLNPARAGIVSARAKGRKGKQKPGNLLDYRWSSLAAAYAVPPSKRPPWMAVGAGLEILGERDTATGRRRYVERLERSARSEPAKSLGLVELEGQTLHSTLRRGWYWGSQAFREKLLEQFGGGLRQKAAKNRTARSSLQMREHGEREALRLLEEGKRALDLRARDLAGNRLPKGDPRRAAIAWAIWTRTSGVRQEWIAEHLNLRSAPNVCRVVRRFRETPPGKLPPTVRKWLKELERSKKDE